jgi:catechol 2,3-dioxygenase-like lactoylglutathione lyase family enzyme
VNLVVLEYPDVPAAKRFYEALGLELRREEHGAGPEHWSCDLSGVVLEIYPGGAPAIGRIGFEVDDLAGAIARIRTAGGSVRSHAPGVAAVVSDPGGVKVHLTQRAAAHTAPADDSSWCVMRQDDHGNCFEVSGGHTRAQAEARCAELAASGHKQLYWIRPDAAGG